jgi:hypothetical protein
MLHGLINNVTKCPSPKINKIIEEKKKKKKEREREPTSGEHFLSS